MSSRARPRASSPNTYEDRGDPVSEPTGSPGSDTQQQETRNETNRSSGGDGHILQLILPVVSEAWSFDGDHLKSHLQPAGGIRDFTVRI